ncbi:MAG: zinc ABC transporter substrate-binding protein, partial [Syntrophales bacterium]|nr:zinc ABC transporter substrate-binding protein [Syntrophales bacterium]
MTFSVRGGKTWATFTLFLASLLMLAACTEGNKTPPRTGVKVVVTLFPLYDFARQVGGGRVEVDLLLPPGVEAHAYEPRPSDVAKIQGAKCFIYTGRRMERWADNILKGMDGKGPKVVDASRGVTIYRDDPHIWLDFANAMTMVENIAAGLGEVDPDNASFYR